ncbi:MAG: MBL fold metallo-hydrolase RNA specificity domain-containing protein [Burkholderiaceae bacterium]
MHIRFEGAAGEVTGSRMVVHTAGDPHGRTTRPFLIDCGMFQGNRDADEKNLRPFEPPPRDLQFVVLTHAHIDHSGLLPRLCAQGFRGPIYCTPATLDLLEVLLADSAHIQSGERQRAEKRKAAGKWRGELPTPLYSTRDVAQCLSQCVAVPYEHPTDIAPGIRLTLVDAGHILGAASAILDITEPDAHGRPHSRRLVASGDIGTRHRPIMNDPVRIERADVLIVESTYGDRLHRSLQETEDELVEVITTTLQQGGNVVMPAFAVGRTQEVIAILLDLIRRKRLPFLSIFVDSPMATTASRITQSHLNILDRDAQNLFAWLQSHPNAAHIRFTADVNDSKALNQIKGGAIILSASGMCEAGRIVHHLFWNLPRPQCSVVITGFQAAGTRGRALVDHAKTVRLLGREVPVKALVHTLGGLSAHGDQADLLWWCQGFTAPPQKVFITHGEAQAAENFAQVLTSELGWAHAVRPQRGELYPC